MPELTPTIEAAGDTTDLGELIRFYTGIIVRGWRLIVLALVVCLTVAAVYLAKTPRMYEATARLLVLQQGGRPLSVASNDPNQIADRGDDYIPTHALIVSSPLVVRRAIESLGVNNLPTLLRAQEQGLDPGDEAIEQLVADRPDRLAKILRVCYRARTREEAVLTVTAITESYQKFLEDSFQKKSNEVVVLIAKARDELNKELEQLEKEYVEFRLKNEALIVDEHGRSFAALRLEQLEHAAGEAKIRAIQLNSQLELGRGLAGQGRGLWSIAHALEQLGSSASSVLIANTAVVSQGASLDYLRQLSQEQQKMAERFGPQNAKVQGLKEQIDRAQEDTRAVRRRLEQGETTDLVASIEQSLKAIEGMRAEFKREFDKGLEDAKKVENDLLVEANLRTNLERQRALFNTVVDQLKQAQFTGDYSSITAQIIEAPNASRYPVRPRIVLALAAAILAGCVLGMMAAIVGDRLDQRLRSPKEIRQILDVPVLGYIPQLPEGHTATGGNVGLVAHTMPRSRWAECYRVARTNLEFLRRNQGFQVILVTSPHAGDGKTTSTSNLAISLAHAGRKVILIDADLRRPCQDKVHQVGKGQGLSHLLRDLMPVDRVIQRTSVENLDLITAGPVVPNPAELLTSPRMSEILKELRQSYDLVIVDSSPLLAVTDPSIIGALVDGIVLVVHASTLKRHDAHQVMESLRALGTPLLGTVINGIGGDANGYGYGSSYGYGYGSGYGSARGTYGHGIYGEGHVSRDPDPAATAEDGQARGSQESPLDIQGTSSENDETARNGSIH